jgi:hypothetical protein
MRDLTFLSLGQLDDDVATRIVRMLISDERTLDAWLRKDQIVLLVLNTIYHHDQVQNNYL